MGHVAVLPGSVRSWSTSFKIFIRRFSRDLVYTKSEPRTVLQCIALAAGQPLGQTILEFGLQGYHAIQVERDEKVCGRNDNDLGTLFTVHAPFTIK